MILQKKKKKNVNTFLPKCYKDSVVTLKKYTSALECDNSSQFYINYNKTNLLTFYELTVQDTEGIIEQ